VSDQGTPSDALTAFLQTTADAVKSPPVEPAPDPRVAAAFALGWQMAELYRPETRTRTAPAAREDLPGLGRLGDDERAQISLQQVDAALAKLADALAKAKVTAPDTRPLHECLENAHADPAARARAVRDLHVKLLGAFTAADFRLGKAYGLGRSLADTCRTPVSASSLLAEFRPHRVAKLRGWLDDLASALPAHAGRSVSISLGRWAEHMSAHPEQAVNQAAAEQALPGLRRQGQLWRALLSGEKSGPDMLALENYLEAASGLFKTTGKLVWRFLKRFYYVVFVAVILFGVGVWLMLDQETSASIVAGASSILAGLGLTWKSAGSALGGLGAKTEQHLWGAELDSAVAEAITLLPNTTDHGERLALATQTPASTRPKRVRPQLLESVLDPDRLQRKLASIERERSDEKYAEVPPEQRLPHDHFDELSEDIRREQDDPHRVTRATSSPTAGVPAPPPVVYMSRRPKVSQFMSVVTHCFEEELDAPAVEKLSHLAGLDDLWRDVERWTEDLRSRFRAFGPCDVRFLEPKLAQVLAGFLGRHAFSTDPPEVRLAERAKVFVVGDWATALPQACNVAARIREQLLQVPAGIECHVIHLGDTYYSGLEDECRRRFLDQWPVPAGSRARSWTLAGNHDMYSGGHGYFDVLLADPRFAAQANCSYFALVNDDWQILSLDSSYKDPDNPDLQEPQAQWLSERVSDAGARKTMMLTHHQPFSAYETVNPQLAQTVSRALAGSKLEAWLWGHEHRCTVYERDTSELAHYTALIGHGGVPSLRSAASGPEGESEVERAKVDWEFLDCYQVGDDRWGLGGFAVLTFTGPTLEIQYYDEYGKERRNGEPFAYQAETASLSAATAVPDGRPVRAPDVLPADDRSARHVGPPASGQSG